MFADLLIRRAGLFPDRRSRSQRLESLISRYLSAPGYSTLSADLVSRGDSHPGLLGDEWAGTHLQGEVLTVMLDLKIRDATSGKHNVDDVMKLLATRFDRHHGIANSDIERALNEVCGCDLGPFFGEYIYGAKQVDLDQYLKLIGLRAEIRSIQAVDQEGGPAVDLRIGPVAPTGVMKLRITNSNSVWFRSGCRTGDRLVSANGKELADWSEFRSWLRSLKIGDQVKLLVEREGKRLPIEFELVPYKIPSVHILEIEGATQKQRQLRNDWLNGI